MVRKGGRIEFTEGPEVSEEFWRGLVGLGGHGSGLVWSADKL